MDGRIAQDEAAGRLRKMLAKPDMGREFPVEGEFDPWEMFPSLYGTYDKDFDDMAIEVLSGLAATPLCWDRDDLGAQMFREMLCTARLCDYGTSPRVCFPTQEFREILPEFIKRWKRYRDKAWQ